MRGVSRQGSKSHEKKEVEAVLASTLFCRAPTLSRILKYICEQHFQGKSNDIKEYNIAVEALGRNPDFRPGDDSIVRVEAARLRRHLKKYYETDGASHPVKIKLSDVGYTPQFVYSVPVESLPADDADAGTPDGEGPEGAPFLIDAVPSSSLDFALPNIDPPEKPPASSRSFPWRPLALILAGVLILGVVFVATTTEVSRPIRALFSSRSASPAVPSADSAVRIRVGSSSPEFLDADASKWLSDRYFSGGVAFDRPNRQILRTVNQPLYQTGREGHFSYAIPLKPGVYELHLHFAETFYDQGPSGGAEKQRLFDVSLNGAPLLPGFDIVKDAAGPNTADEKVFKDVSPGRDGFLRLDFAQRRNEATLNGIEILPGIPGRMRPVRIVSRGRAYYDRQGNLWSSDRYFAGGRLSEWQTPVADAADPAMYTSSRWGNFTYAIPVAAGGAYRVRLYFAETAWGPSTNMGGGAGSRVFDVYCNGKALLTQFDIFKEAGGESRAAEMTFRHLKPDAQNKLVLSFVPVADYATVFAIEVEDEGR